jgi:hypothetical protein
MTEALSDGLLDIRSDTIAWFTGPRRFLSVGSKSSDDFTFKLINRIRKQVVKLILIRWNRKFSLCRLPVYSGFSLDMSHCNRN